MAPVLRTVGASSAMAPPLAAVRLPSLTTLPLAPSPLKRITPAMKSLFAMRCVVAARPPTSARAPGAK